MKRRQKVIALALGLFFTLAFTETILLGIHTLENRKQKEATRATGAGDAGAEFKILCVGNSYTAGAGAPPGHSYADHLQRMLDGENRKTQIRVINRGRSNANSTYVLEVVEQSIEELHPQVIAIMAGEPNVWNRHHYSRFLERAGRAKESAPTMGVRLYDWLYGFHTFRLFTLLLRPHVTASTYVAGKYSVAFPGEDVSNFRHIAMRWIGGLEGGSAFDIYRLTDAQRSEALTALEAMVAAGEGNRDVYNALARLYALSAKDFYKGAAYYERAIDADGLTFNYYAYRDLTRDIPGFLADPAATEVIKKLVEKASATFPGPSLYAEMTNWFDIATYEWAPDTVANRAKMIRFLELARRVRPTSIRTHKQLADLYMLDANSAAAARVIMEGILHNPFSTEVDVYPILGDIQAKTGDQDLRSEITKFLEELGKKYPSEVYRATSLDDQKLEEWIRSDIQEMIRISEARGIKIVLQSYAPLRKGGYREADKVIQDIAKSGRYPFADNMTEFNKSFRSGVDPESLFSNEFGPSDSHLNSAGYKFMAEILHKTLADSQLLPK